MKAGKLRDIIEIFKPVLNTTEYGDSVTSYEFHYKTRAEVIYNSGTKTNENNEVFYSTSRTFRVRYYVDVTEPMRIKFKDKYYQIISIEPNKYYNNKTIITELVNE